MLRLESTLFLNSSWVRSALSFFCLGNSDDQISSAITDTFNRFLSSLQLYIDRRFLLIFSVHALAFYEHRVFMFFSKLCKTKSWRINCPPKITLFRWIMVPSTLGYSYNLLITDHSSRTTFYVEVTRRHKDTPQVRR